MIALSSLFPLSPSIPLTYLSFSLLLSLPIYLIWPKTKAKEKKYFFRWRRGGWGIHQIDIRVFSSCKSRTKKRATHICFQNLGKKLFKKCWFHPFSHSKKPLLKSGTLRDFSSISIPHVTPSALHVLLFLQAVATPGEMYLHSRNFPFPLSPVFVLKVIRYSTKMNEKKT